MQKLSGVTTTWFALDATATAARAGFGENPGDAGDKAITAAQRETRAKAQVAVWTAGWVETALQT